MEEEDVEYEEVEVHVCSCINMVPMFLSPKMKYCPLLHLYGVVCSKKNMAWLMNSVLPRPFWCIGLISL